MQRFIIGRVVQSIVSMFVVSIVVFALVRLSGDPIQIMMPAEASKADIELVRAHLDLLRAGGRVVVLTPQEAGFRSDPTHVEFMDFDKVEAVVRTAGLEVDSRYSFPLPRFTGALFKYNEFVTLAHKPAA